MLRSAFKQELPRRFEAEERDHLTAHVELSTMHKHRVGLKPIVRL